MTVFSADDFDDIFSAAIKANRSSGGRGVSTATSQKDLLGVEGLEFIRKSMKGNAVRPLDFLRQGSEFFRKENVDQTLRGTMRSAKVVSKVTIVDLEVRFVDDTVRRMSAIMADAQKAGTKDQARKVVSESLSKMKGFGQVFIKNEQFAVAWPLGDSLREEEGDPMATDIAPILAPWSLFVEACEKFAVKQ